MAKEKLTVLIKAKELIEYTFCMTESTKRFPKKTRFTFINRMQNLSLDIYSKLLKINESYQSWLGHASHGNCYRLIQKMNKKYNSIFEGDG